MNMFKDVTVLVTGGAGGIGRDIVLGFASRGAKVSVVDHKSREAAEAVVEEIRSSGAEGVAVTCDVSDWEAVRRAVAVVREKLGSIEVLVNCAGIVKDDLIVSMPVENWRKVIDTNLTGAFHFIKAVSEEMAINRRGRIINISSLAGERGGRGQANYAASKGGLNSLTRAAALELGPRGVTVNAVAPGMVLTDMSRNVIELGGPRLKRAVPLRRFANPEDITAVVLFLASPAASYITGQIIEVDGGLSGAVQF